MKGHLITLLHCWTTLRCSASFGLNTALQSKRDSNDIESQEIKSSVLFDYSFLSIVWFDLTIIWGNLMSLLKHSHVVIMYSIFTQMICVKSWHHKSKTSSRRLFVLPVSWFQLVSWSWRRMFSSAPLLSWATASVASSMRWNDPTESPTPPTACSTSASASNRQDIFLFIRFVNVYNLAHSKHTLAKTTYRFFFTVERDSSAVNVPWTATSWRVVLE